MRHQTSSFCQHTANQRSATANRKGYETFTLLGYVLSILMEAPVCKMVRPDPRLFARKVLALFIYTVAGVFVLAAFPLSAETPGKDGDASVSGQQTLNQYAPVAGNLAAGSTQITVLGLGTNLPSLRPGDLIMIYQAQGATISGSDTGAYGSIIAMGSAGRYEFQTVRAISGNTLFLHNFGATCSGLRYDYVAGGRPQIIRVPQFRNLTITGSGRITPAPWNGATGGIVAITVSGTLSIAGAIDASRSGFRGGQIDNLSNASGSSYFGYRSNLATNGAEKGESIAGYRTDLPGSNFYGRGAPANGGGGGNSHNAGGGGGANGNNGNFWQGQGVPDTSVGQWVQAWNLDPSLNASTSNSGGGRGGYTFSFQNQNALTVPPGDSRWQNDFRRELGGIGGRPLDYEPTGRLFFGGGGGAGDGNNNAAGAGGTGGGIVFIQANSVTGGGVVASNGGDGANTSPAHNDGPGGGGGGGTVIMQSSGTLGVQLNAHGGKGGDQLIANLESEGPGGGGGGGVIATSGGTVASFARGGANGITTSVSLTEFPPNGATRGALGQPMVSAPSLAATPFCRAPNTPVQISKTSRATAITGADRFRIQDAEQTYTISFTNPGAAIDANSVVITDRLPSQVELWTGAFNAMTSVPVAFEDGSDAAATGLGCCTAGQIAFSNSETGNNFSYVPNGEFDANVRRVRISPAGPVAEGYDGARNFFLRMRARISN